MPPFRTEAGSAVDFLREYEEAKNLAQGALQLIQERNLALPNGGPEASRMTASARRKLGTLGTQIDKLLKMVDSGTESAQLSEQERNRRRDMVYDLKKRREQMQSAIRRAAGQLDRDALLEGTSGYRPPTGRETEQTADKDCQGLLQLQSSVMKAQDAELEQMEKAVSSTKHIALAIGEEVDLQTRLLDDLAEEVDVTESRMKAATRSVKQVMQRSSTWKFGFCIFLLVIIFVVVIILAFKLTHLFWG